MRKNDKEFIHQQQVRASEYIRLKNNENGMK